MVKTVIFDFDGVLVESVDIKTNAFARLFEKEGGGVVKKVVDYHLNNAGVSRFEKFRHIYKNVLHRSLTDEKFEELCRLFSKLVMDEVVAAPYVKGAKEFLDNYSSRYSCFISSATPQKEIEEITISREMESYFKGIYGSPKDKGAIVKDVLLTNNISPKEAVYVGDALSDYTAASLNSVPFIARIDRNEEIFSGIRCVKIKDLVNLNEVITNYV